MAASHSLPCLTSILSLPLALLKDLLPSLLCPDVSTAQGSLPQEALPDPPSLLHVTDNLDHCISHTEL